MPRPYLPVCSMLELFVMTSCIKCALFSEESLLVVPLSGQRTELESLAANFDLHNTSCYRDLDRQTIFGIIETAGDGHIGFNSAVRCVADAAVRQLDGLRDT